VVNAQLGLSWRPSEFPAAQLFLGYQYEYWWHIGRVSGAGTNADLMDQGVVLRAEINF
jgi:hypothetical protein